MQYESIAAVDLGSNSFRLEVGRVVEDQIYTLDSLKDPVRLASGLQADKSLDEASQERGLIALSRFGERLLVVCRRMPYGPWLPMPCVSPRMPIVFWHGPRKR